MHDLILAKEISDVLKSVMKKEGINNLKKVNIEVGDVSKVHKHEDGEHHHDIKIENLEFNLKHFFKETEFKIRRGNFEGWKLVDIEGE